MLLKRANICFTLSYINIVFRDMPWHCPGLDHDSCPRESVFSVLLSLSVLYFIKLPNQVGVPSGLPLHVVGLPWSVEGDDLAVDTGVTMVPHSWYTSRCAMEFYATPWDAVEMPW